MFRSNNEIVDQMLEVNITGNVIPQVWYQTLVNEKGRAQLLAINILADIVYWYRPVEVRDEVTGQVQGYKKKFRGDLLQKNYQQLEAQFGAKASAIRTALRFLEDMNVVKRVFRTIRVGGLTLTNVMYLELNVEGLKAVTFPELEDGDDIDEPPLFDFLDDGMGEFIPLVKNDSPMLRNFTTSNPEKSKTNTETITEITTEIINQSINQEMTSGRKQMDGLMEISNEPVILDPTDELSETTINSIRTELAMNKGIPYAAACDAQKMQKILQTLCYWNDHEIFYNGDSLSIESFRQVLTSLIEMATARQACQYGNSFVSYKHVIDQLNVIFRKDSGVNGVLFFVQRTVEKVKSAFTDKKIIHPEKYLKTLIWNNFRTYQVEWENYFLQTQKNSYQFE